VRPHPGPAPSDEHVDPAARYGAPVLIGFRSWRIEKDDDGTAWLCGRTGRWDPGWHLGDTDAHLGPEVLVPGDVVGAVQLAGEVRHIGDHGVRADRARPIVLVRKSGLVRLAKRYGCRLVERGDLIRAAQHWPDSPPHSEPSGR
jgi:hypothetical protein